MPTFPIEGGEKRERGRSEKFDPIKEYQISRCGRIAINCQVD
jgi:hypothetical protein